MDDYLVILIEQNIFFEVNEDDIGETFMATRHCRPNKHK